MAQLTCVDPEAVRDVQIVLRHFAQLVRWGQSLRRSVRSPATVFHLTVRTIDTCIEDRAFALPGADACCAAGCAAAALRDRSAVPPAFVCNADEALMHKIHAVFANRD
jgi:hypothetical protein